MEVSGTICDLTLALGPMYTKFCESLRVKPFNTCSGRVAFRFLSYHQRLQYHTLGESAISDMEHSHTP